MVNPPAGLLEKILKRIHKEERLLVLRRIFLFSIMLTASLFGFFPALNLLISDLSQSGFLQFLSLTFSDFSTITMYWRSFTMTLLQTLPAISLALFLAVLLTFLQSIKSLTKYGKLLTIKVI
jgi:ABC-type spermidine/putrescine transport system permease subunit I